MNSVKNAIVTMTLLAVGYGAYVVLSNPVPDDLDELAEGSVWQTPEVTTSVTGPDTELPTVSTNQPPEWAPSDVESSTARSDLPAADDPQQLPSEIASPWPSTDTAPSEIQPPASTATAATAAEPSQDAHANFYVSRAEAQPDQDNGYPTTSAANVPLTAPHGDVPPIAAQNGAAAAPHPTANYDAGNAEFEALWQTAQADLSSGQIGDVLGTLSAWYEEPSLSPQQRERLIPLLDQLAGTVIYSRDSFLEPAHVVQQGETLFEVAQQYQVPAEFLARINGIEPPFELFPGETIKVIQGPFRAEVNCGQGQITLFLGRYYAGRFAARIGPELPSDSNTYEVASVEPGLEYFDTRSGARIARDSPDNPYGLIWISLRGNQITTAHRVGIHVDNGDTRRGCIGVSPTDASDLAAILGPGSAVQVRP